MAYFEIKKNIIEGELLPGQAVIEEELATQLKISRTPLREALQRLELDELLIRQPNGRLKIAPISVKEAEEMFLIRILLEGVVVRQATDKIEEREIQQLHNNIRMCDEAAQAGRFDDFMNTSSQFHFMLYEISGNKTAVKILYQLNDHFMRYRRLVPAKNFHEKNSSKEHQRVLDYIIARDASNAEKAMQEHLIKSKKIALDVIRGYKNLDQL